MAITIDLVVVSAEKEIFSGAADMVFVPASEGEIGIAPNHAPLLTTLKAGELRVQSKGEAEKSFFISGGMLEIQPRIITVLADTAVRAKDLDEARALQAKEAAEKLLADKQDTKEYYEAAAELKQAIAQLQTIDRLRKASKSRH